MSVGKTFENIELFSNNIIANHFPVMSFLDLYPTQQALLIVQGFVQNLPVAVKTVKLSLWVSIVSFKLHAAFPTSRCK